MPGEEQTFALEIFEGPLDLLLYLIRKDEIDIYNIPIQGITEQYLKYLGLMRMLDLDMAGDFLAMAATLMQVKSRLLLPPDERAAEEEEEGDPRWELVRQLLEYKRFKEAADSLHDLGKQQEKIFSRGGEKVPAPALAETPLGAVSIFELLGVFSQVVARAEKGHISELEPDPFSLDDGRSRILSRIASGAPVSFLSLFDEGETVIRVVVVFLALLELIRQKAVQVIQQIHFGEIMITRLLAAPEGT
ncbi:MAG: segregation/condensation protein A [Candidatus Aureabacteria bacterium]|nr:segregation/condensation protein A [Candidatus Auribacterota bacterium]